MREATFSGPLDHLGRLPVVPQSTELKPGMLKLRPQVLDLIKYSSNFS